MTKFHKRLWTGLAIMALLTPLGIYLPRQFGAGEAWGEWGTETLEKMLGFVPEGMKKIADLWKAPVADYNFGEGGSYGAQALSYIGSAILGIAVAALILYLISKFLVKHGK
ncbi:MAG TPA: PDGLE domain-containing protein [Dissulfurispiraceae bacterium]|nr:PDGLE domain-containing protein [Dissulfurispiraceae bacterium]